MPTKQSLLEMCDGCNKPMVPLMPTQGSPGDNQKRSEFYCERCHKGKPMDRDTWLELVRLGYPK